MGASTDSTNTSTQTSSARSDRLLSLRLCVRNESAVALTVSSVVVAKKAASV
jgi:hypothetical protein